MKVRMTATATTGDCIPSGFNPATAAKGPLLR